MGESKTQNPLGFSANFYAALTLALSVHHRDVRKGTSIPYVAHLFSVCSLVLYDGGGETEAMAALLHDVLEDHPDRVSPQTIEEWCGTEVLALIRSCSDTPVDYAGGPKPPWRQRKDTYLKHLAHLFSSTGEHGKEGSPMETEGGTFAERVLRVSLADKLDNIRSMVVDCRKAAELSPEAEKEFWGRFNAGKEDQLWYYESLLAAYTAAHRASGTSLFLLEEFKRWVGEFKALVST